MFVAWFIVAVDLAGAVFAAWLASELDFFRTGINWAQVLSGLAAVMLLLTAATLAWPRWGWMWKTCVALEAIALIAVVAAAVWTALTAGGASNPMRFYWMHCSALGALFSANLWALWAVAGRTP